MGYYKYVEQARHRVTRIKELNRHRTSELTIPSLYFVMRTSRLCFGTKTSLGYQLRSRATIYFLGAGLGGLYARAPNLGSPKTTVILTSTSTTFMVCAPAKALRHELLCVLYPFYPIFYYFFRGGVFNIDVLH